MADTKKGAGQSDELSPEELEGAAGGAAIAPVDDVGTNNCNCSNDGCG